MTMMMMNKTIIINVVVITFIIISEGCWGKVTSSISSIHTELISLLKKDDKQHK